MTKSNLFRLATSQIWTVLGILLLVLHLTIKDLFTGLAAIYYLTPFPFIGLLFIPGAAFSIVRRRYVAGIIHLIAGLVVFVLPFRYSLISSTVTEFPDEEAMRLKVVLWTPDNFEFSTVDEGFLYLSGFDADLIGLIEANVDIGRQKRMAGEVFPNHKMELLPYGMIFLHNGELISSESHMFGGGKGLLNICVVKVKGRLITVALYDQDSNPLYSRRESIMQLNAFLMSQTSGDLILMGDFNTPHTAQSVSILKESLNPVFSRVNSGNRYTWPSWFPFMAFDQIWYSSAFHPLDIAIQDTSLANHRPVLMEFSLNPVDR